MGGYQQLVRGDVMRGKFRNSLSKPEPFDPGQPTTVNFTLPDVAHTFRAGHSHGADPELLVPDRRPQPAEIRRYLQRQESDFQPATQRSTTAARCRRIWKCWRFRDNHLILGHCSAIAPRDHGRVPVVRTGKLQPRTSVRSTQPVGSGCRPRLVGCAPSERRSRAWSGLTPVRTRRRTPWR